MLKAMRDMIRRMGFVGAVVLTMAFALPAFESHACAEERSPPTAEAVADAADDAGQACPDCGPACANGCCHAPHVATAAEMPGAPAAPRFAEPAHWRHVTGAPLDRPGGPDRPPRA